MSALQLREDAPGKINLCLYLGPTRADGRHELVTVYESVGLSDTLELTESEADVDQVICPGVEGPNLVSDALAALRTAGWSAPALRIAIDKRIPVAAGMAGGSADAAAALRLAMAVGQTHPDWHLAFEDALAIAERLGSDVPAQLVPGLSLGTGAGEIVEQLAPLARHALAILPLDAALSTPAVYREADRLELPRPEAELRDRLAEVTGWMRHGAEPPARLLINDLAPAARSLCPQIDGALAALSAAGAELTFVCGSGPTCAGLWWGAGAFAAAQDAVTRLKSEFRRAVAVEPVVGPVHPAQSAR